MALPSYVVDFRGHPACPCLWQGLPAYERELQRRGLLAGQLRIYQLIGGAPQSGGTHTKGGAFDLLDLPGGTDLWVARQMGADATWSRPYNWDGRGGMAHMHGVLRGCPHNGPARYQYDSVTSGGCRDRSRDAPGSKASSGQRSRTCHLSRKTASSSGPWTACSRRSLMASRTGP